MEHTQEDKNGVKTSLVYIQRDINDIKEDTKKLREKFDTFEAGRLTSLEVAFAKHTSEFEPVRKVVYGMVTVILTAVFATVMYMIFK